MFLIARSQYIINLVEKENQISPNSSSIHSTISNLFLIFPTKDKLYDNLIARSDNNSVNQKYYTLKYTYILNVIYFIYYRVALITQLQG